MSQRLVLVGTGHAHAQVLKAWAQTLRPEVDLVVVSHRALAPYPGMVPGWLSDAYRFNEIVIDFLRLCEQAGARWVNADLEGVDPQRQNLTLIDGACLRYDWLSLDVGSTGVPSSGVFRAHVLPMRPLADLRDRYEPLLSHWRSDTGHQPSRIVVLGGGAAGFESLMAVLRRQRDERPDRVVQVSLMTRSLHVLAGYPAACAVPYVPCARQMSMCNWRPHGAIRSAKAAIGCSGPQARSHTPGKTIPHAGADWRSASKGYAQIDAHLPSVSHPNIFAVGDCAQWAQPLHKVGVCAVRMGPVLEHNHQDALGGGTP